jgi:hypothetical protein
LHAYYSIVQNFLNEIFLFYRILRLRETGLISYWEKNFQADPRPCLNDNSQRRRGRDKSATPTRLSLKNLSGAFVILVVGYLIAFLVFLNEIIVFRWRKHIGNRQ